MTQGAVLALLAAVVPLLVALFNWTLKRVDLFLEMRARRRDGAVADSGAVRLRTIQGTVEPVSVLAQPIWQLKRFGWQLIFDFAVIVAVAGFLVLLQDPLPSGQTFGSLLLGTSVWVYYGTVAFYRHRRMPKDVETAMQAEQRLVIEGSSSAIAEHCSVSLRRMGAHLVRYHEDDKSIKIEAVTLDRQTRLLVAGEQVQKGSYELSVRAFTRASSRSWQQSSKAARRFVELLCGVRLYRPPWPTESVKARWKGEAAVVGARNHAEESVG